MPVPPHSTDPVSRGVALPVDEADLPSLLITDTLRESLTQEAHAAIMLHIFNQMTSAHGILAVARESWWREFFKTSLDLSAEILGGEQPSTDYLDKACQVVQPHLSARNLGDLPAIAPSWWHALFSRVAIVVASAGFGPCHQEESDLEDQLTRREIEILSYAAQGLSNGAIARELWVTEPTVKFHLSNVYRKLGVKNRTEASRYFLDHCSPEQRIASGLRIA